jgi:hypothetical protein
MISIKQAANMAYIETLYAQYQKESAGHKVDLELPNKLQEETIGVLPSLIQFIASIVRDEKLNHLKAKIKDASHKDQLESAAKSYLWYVTSCLHWLNDFNYEDGQSLKADIRPVNTQIHEMMRNFVPLGNTFMLTCFDHLPKNAGLLKMFYQAPNYQIVEEQMIEQYVYQIILNLAARTNKTAFGPLAPILKPVTAIVYELFKNTDDWATKDRFGDKVEPSVRGVYFRYYKNFPTNILQNTEDNRSLNTYFAHPIFKLDAEQKISFIEISVFDSGDGFAGRRLGDTYREDLPVDEEVSIVKQCLTKYWTNEEGKRGVVKGIGLDRVLATINGKGFLRIRTNKTHVYRDMVLDPYRQEALSENISLYDFANLSDQSFTTHYNTKGTVITIILPLESLY